jgi:hypothetical protein
MRKATLTRSPSTDQGTFGTLVLDDGTTFHSLELPWRDNARGLSCIPAGTYVFRKVDSPKHGECYQALDVPGRSEIQIHVANYAGDVTLGYRSDLMGCIALGKEVGPLEIPGPLKRQLCVLRSGVAIKEFEANTGLKDLELTIVG